LLDTLQRVALGLSMAMPVHGDAQMDLRKAAADGLVERLEIAFVRLDVGCDANGKFLIEASAGANQGRRNPAFGRDSGPSGP
jgi:hypothetical protein